MRAFLVLLVLLAPFAGAQDEAIGTAIVDNLQEAQQRLATSGMDILVVYLRQEDRMAISQAEKTLDDDTVDAIIREYELDLKQLATDEEREERLKLAAAEIAADLELFTDLMETDISEEGPAEALAPAQPSPLCALLKDGVCDRACPGIDLDCQCGDGACESYENLDICPLDCRPPTNYLCAVARDRVCDPQCPGFDIDCEVISLVDTTMAYYAEDDSLYGTVMAILSVAIMLLFGVSMWLLHDIYRIKFGGP